MRRSGFTLIEILVVVVIIGLLATLAGPGIYRKLFLAERTIAEAKCKEYHDAVWTYRMFHPQRVFPATLADLTEPIAEGEKPIVPALVRDPWGHPYRLVIEGETIRVWSDGPDRAEGTPDDLCYVPIGDDYS